MTQEQIETKCQDYSKSATPSFINGTFERYAIAQAFEDGANWRINSVWHDRSETPKFGCSILGITIFGDPIIDVPFGIEYDVDIDMSNIKKWAYLKDLMPNE